MVKKHICITGMDGTGKSTVIKGLGQQFSSCYTANIWDLMSSDVKGLPFKSKKDIDEFLCGLTPDSRLLFLAHAMRYAIDMAFKSEKEIIISDSYFYKYFATEKALGADPLLIKSLISSFPEPDVIIELVLPINEVVKRKCHFSRYECGLSEIPGDEVFSNFQLKVLLEWEMFENENWHCISAMKSPEETLEQVINTLSLGI